MFAGRTSSEILHVMKASSTIRGVHKNWICWPKLKIWWTKLEKPKPLSFDLIQFILKQIKTDRLPIKTGRLPIYHLKHTYLKTFHKP